MLKGFSVTFLLFSRDHRGIDDLGKYPELAIFTVPSRASDRKASQVMGLE